MLVHHSIKEDHFSDLIENFKPRFIFLDDVNQNHLVRGQKSDICGLFECERGQDYVLHDDLALLLTTSGSTGSRSLVRISHGNILSNTENIMEYLDIRSCDRVISTLPMSYTYGLSIINSHLRAGACLILTEASIVSPQFWKMFKQHKPTTFGGVPYIFDMLKKLRFAKMDLSNLRYITQAGGKISAKLADEFTEICQDNDIEFILMYGQTEATARISYLPWPDAPLKGGSIGIPIPGGEIWLEDEDGNIISDAQTAGELVYKGPNVSLGYATGYLDLCKGDENQGVLKTGDIATRDAEGYYYIVGRKKRFLKIYGNRVNLDDVEAILTEAGYDCACIGDDDDLKVMVTDNAQEVREYIINNTSLVPAGFTVKYIDEIPRNDAGKILYSVLEEGQ